MAQNRVQIFGDSGTALIPKGLGMVAAVGLELQCRVHNRQFADSSMRTKLKRFTTRALTAQNCVQILPASAIYQNLACGTARKWYSDLITHTNGT
jgi:hypothetical protein